MKESYSTATAYHSIEEIRARKALLQKDIKTDEEKIDEKWHSLFKKPPGTLEDSYPLAACREPGQLGRGSARRIAACVEALSQIQEITVYIPLNGYFHSIIREQEAFWQSAVGFIVKAYLMRDMNEIGSSRADPS